MSDLYERLKAYEGRPALSGRGRDPVNAPMIRHWCEAMGDTGAAYAGADPVAPPTMLQAWTLGGLGGPGGGAAGRTAAYGGLLALLDEAGCTAVVATDCEQEYVQPLRPGDVITFDGVIEAVTPRKETRLGAGHFVTTRTEIRAGGELAGIHRFRILKYAPPPQPLGAPAPSVARPRPVVNRDNAGFWEGVAGHRLLIQRCDACGRLRFPWLPGCGACGSPRWTAVPASGAGTVHSYVVMHHPLAPGFDGPYAVGLIELAEGVRMISNVTGVPPDRVRVGMPVALDFVRADGQDLPVFRATGPSGETPRTSRALGSEPSGSRPPSGEGPRTSRPPNTPPPNTPPPGHEIPPLTVPVTRTLIVAGALASRDYQDVHHDPEAARAKGAPDIFMNILTTNGLVGRYLTDHFGPEAVLRKVAIRLGVPNYPGDTLVMTGTINSVCADERIAEVGITGTNSLGRHVTGTVTLSLPGEPA